MEKLAKRLWTITFHYNDISRNKENYTLIKQETMQVTMTTAANSITFYAPEEFFLSSYFFIASKIRETMRKN